jgi:hypothetical protein
LRQRKRMPMTVVEALRWADARAAAAPSSLWALAGLLALGSAAAAAAHHAGGQRLRRFGPMVRSPARKRHSAGCAARSCRQRSRNAGGRVGFWPFSTQFSSASNSGG